MAGGPAAWARAVARLLRPGGVFLVHDVHPTTSALQYDRDDDLLVLGEPYFSGGGPSRFDDGTTYASDTRMQNAVTYQWTHDLGEVLNSLLAAGLRIEAFHEHRSIPWKALPTLVRGGRGWELPEGSAQCPLMFSLVARRP
ncbi:hypothetical protein AB1207_23680 [Kineococcus endophyticus]|uniref:Methyltransferase family protein n=1 Tax=Kineococcus endophyticus TaxID=1181883 RepID=A0ABV3PDM8_9ACTN